MEASPFLRECFLYHRSTKTVFSMDSLVLLTPEEVPNPMAQKAFAIMQGFNTVSFFLVRFVTVCSRYRCPSLVY